MCSCESLLKRVYQCFIKSTSTRNDTCMYKKFVLVMHMFKKLSNSDYSVFKLYFHILATKAVVFEVVIVLLKIFSEKIRFSFGNKWWRIESLMKLHFWIILVVAVEVQWLRLVFSLVNIAYEYGRLKQIELMKSCLILDSKKAYLRLYT